jgi:hypothetical protein
MQGRVLHDDGQVEPISFDNMLLRGCMTRNTTFVEGIVIYAGEFYIIIFPQCHIIVQVKIQRQCSTILVCKY